MGLFRSARLRPGSNFHEEFQIWTGVTSNGKSKTQNTVENAYGDLSGTLEPVFFQKARGDPQQASSFLAKLEYCRAVFSAEPENEKWALSDGLSVLL